MTLKKIGFVGLGVMGRSMVSNLMKAGFSLVVNNRTKKSADALVAAGAEWADTPADVMRAADAVITIVGYPKDVEQVYFGENGLFAGFGRGKLLTEALNCLRISGRLRLTDCGKQGGKRRLLLRSQCLLGRGKL